MNLKRELMQIIIGALLLGLFLEMGWLSPDNSFWGNVATGLVMFIIVRLLAFFFS